MEFVFESRFTWLKLLGLILIFGVIYFGLGLCIRILRNTHFAGRFGPDAIRMLQKVRNIFEPIALLLISVAIVFINPVVNGAIFLLAIASLFPYIRQYLAGKVILQTTNFKVGRSIRIQNTEGVIERIYRTGFSLKRPDGERFINFAKIQAEGYTLISNMQSGGLFLFRISPKDPAQSATNKNWLNDLLVSSPYIDWSSKPDIQSDPKAPNQMEVKILLKQNGQSQDFLQLIQDLGYDCTIVQ